MSLGTLKVHLLEAHLTRDTETFGKMDPYCKMVYRDQHWKSSVHSGGGKNPHWEGQHFAVDVKYEGDELEYSIFDDDVGDDDFVGSGKTKVAALTIHGGFDEWFTIQHKGKDSGRVHLKGEWHPHHHH